MLLLVQTYRKKQCLQDNKGVLVYGVCVWEREGGEREGERELITVLTVQVKLLDIWN